MLWERKDYNKSSATDFCHNLPPLFLEYLLVWELGLWERQSPNGSNVGSDRELSAVSFQEVHYSACLWMIQYAESNEEDTLSPSSFGILAWTMRQQWVSQSLESAEGQNTTPRHRFISLNCFHLFFEVQRHTRRVSTRRGTVQYSILLVQVERYHNARADRVKTVPVRSCGGST